MSSVTITYLAEGSREAVVRSCNEQCHYNLPCRGEQRGGCEVV